MEKVDCVVVGAGPAGSACATVGIRDPSAEQARLRTGIFNAYYLPEGRKALYRTISPVNSFRVVLNSVFGADLDMLEDHSYASSYAKPYSFKDITDLVKSDSGE